MNLFKYNILLNGYKPLCYINEENILVFRRLKFYLYNLQDRRLQYICKIEMNELLEALSKIRFTQRIFRLEPRTAILVNDSEIMVSYFGGIFLISLKDKYVKKIHRFRNEMSNVLSFCKVEIIKNVEHGIYYGEYFTNMNKKEVRIFRYDKISRNFKCVYTFNEGYINHIHQIIEDPYRDRIWIFTGDFGNASSIWYTDNNFKSVNCFLKGEQKYRACVVFPVIDGLIYATDTTQSQNYIRKINISGTSIKEEDIEKLNGPCIYGTKCGDWFIWSSSIEPKVNGKRGIFSLISYKRADGVKTWYSEIIGYNKITLETKILIKFKKDIFPMGLLQFGTTIFPYGEASGNQIICYGSALKKVDNDMYLIIL